MSRRSYSLLVARISPFVCSDMTPSMLGADSELGLPDESIAALRHGLDAQRLLGVDAKRIAQFCHGGIVPRGRVDKGVGAPELVGELRARDHLARTLQPRGQPTKQQVLKRDHDAVASQRAGRQVGFEKPEADLMSYWRQNSLSGHRRSIA